MLAPASIPLSDIEFHNLVPEPMAEGVLLARYPVQVRHKLESPGFMTSQEPTGGEMRFVTDALHARVLLMALYQDAEVSVYKGEFQQGSHVLKQGQVHCLHLTPPDRFPIVRPEALRTGGFHPDVWRIVFNRGAVALRGLETFGQSVRPPTPEEKPRRRWLAYGSSITHSSRHGYPHQTARRLGVDVLNKGLSGSCYIEPEAVEFLAADCDWHFATLELGINMRHQHTPEVFNQRAGHLVRRCVEAKPGRPVVLITVFPNFGTFGQIAAPQDYTHIEEAFNGHLRDIAEQYHDRNVHLIEGSSILSDFSLLGVDLLHPTEYGQGLMAENLARALTPLIAPSTETTPR